jgi:Putative adhesin
MRTVRNLALVSVVVAVGCLPVLAVPTGHFDRTLKVNGAVDLDVVSSSGNITVHTGNSDTVLVSAKIHASNSWLFGGASEDRIRRIEQNPPIEQQGNIIHIGHTMDRELFRNISIDYDLTVPAQTRMTAQTGSGDQVINGLQLPLTAKTGSGNITVDNLGTDAKISSGSGDLKIGSVKGTLNATAGSGNIHAEGVAGEINASTGSGDVEMRQVAAGNVKVGTGSGNIKLHGIKGGLRADAGSGDIQADGEPTGDWRLGAGSGNITLKVASQASFNIDARTSSGSLKVSRPVTVQGTMSHNRIQGKVGNGGPLLDVHTGSGNIIVD